MLHDVFLQGKSMNHKYVFVVTMTDCAKSVRKSKNHESSPLKHIYLC